MIFKFFYKRYKSRIYDEIVKEFMGEIPDTVKEPVLEFLADRRVLFEKFLSIQAYHIQRARVQAKKSTDFYDGALMIIRAFLSAVNRKIQDRTVMVPEIDSQAELQDTLKGVGDFLKKGKEIFPG